jgi:tetratricopeptide (TPR) repeat protein
MKIYIFILFLTTSLFSESIQKAYELISKEEYSKAIQVLEKILETEKEHAVALTNLGYSYFKLGNYEKSISAYKKSYEINPSKDSALGLTWSYLRNGNYKESEVFAKKVLELDPDNYLAELALADIYYYNSNCKDAYPKYLELENKFGKSESISYKLSVCESYLGKEKESEKRVDELYKSSPQDKEIRKLLGLNPTIPYAHASLEYASFNFSGSDVIGSGNRKGGKVDFSFDDSLSFRLGYHNSVSENNYRTSGVGYYLADTFNLLQYSLYNYNQSLIQSYLRLPLNQYNLYKIVSANDFNINYYDGAAFYKPSLDRKFSFQYFSAQGNTSLVGNSNAAKITAEFGTYYKLGLSFTSIYTPSHNGQQTDISFSFPFLRNFYSYSNLFGQYLSKKETDYILIGINPVTTTQFNYYINKGYAMFVQEFGYSNQYFYSGIGFKTGNALTPTIGDSWIYTPFLLKSGGYIFIGKNISEMFSAKLEYSKDNWVDTLEKRVSSNFIKFQITMRF